MPFSMNDLAMRTAWTIALRTSVLDLEHIEATAMGTFLIAISQPP